MPRQKTGRVALDLPGLIGVNALLRLSEGVKRDAAVETWLTTGPIELRSIAREWFAKMRRCGDDVRELIHDGCPVACVDDAPFAYVNTYTSHVNIGFFYGAALQDPERLLQGSGKRMRHAKLTPGREFNVMALVRLIDAGYTDIKARLGADPRSPGAR